jgi:hypothetical protein
MVKTITTKFQHVKNAFSRTCLQQVSLDNGFLAMRLLCPSGVTQRKMLQPRQSSLLQNEWMARMALIGKLRTQWVTSILKQRLESQVTV